MTQGKLMLLIISSCVMICCIGELIYRYKCRRLKETSNLSDYGIREAVSRPDCYMAVFMGVICIMAIIGVICAIITRWDAPIENSLIL